MLEPLAVDPNRSVAPAANSIASARLVFPAPAGPTSAITRVPLVDSPGPVPFMCDSPFVRFTGARVASKGARAPHQETSTVRLFSAEGKGGRYGSRAVWERSGAHSGFDAHGKSSGRFEAARSTRASGGIAVAHPARGAEAGPWPDLAADVAR